MGRWKQDRFVYARKDIELIAGNYHIFITPCRSVSSYNERTGGGHDWTEMVDRKADFDQALDSLGKRGRWNGMCWAEEDIIKQFLTLNHQQRLIMWDWVNERGEAGERPILKSPDRPFYKMLRKLNTGRV